jgi:N-methylhydantoinase A
MRYTGQGGEIPITLPEAQAENPDPATYQRLFEEDYVKLFGRAVDGMDVEITVWAVNATTAQETVQPIAMADKVGATETSGARVLFDPALGKQVDAGVIAREAIATGQTVAGPAAIVEDETTIILPVSRRAICQPDGCIDISVQS